MKAAGLVLETLYPKRCLWCGRVLGFTGEACCGEEAAAIALPATPLPLREIHTAAEWIAEAWALYQYEEPMVHAIRRLKFDGEEHLAHEFGVMLGGLCKESGLAGWADMLVPIPMAKKDRKNRGYNQTELLAAAAAKTAGVPPRRKAMAKLYETPRQSSLAKEERAANVAGAYGVTSAAEVKGKNILLLDDIITTGSTLNECAKMLLATGANEVRAVCVAATMPGRHTGQNTAEREKERE